MKISSDFPLDLRDERISGELKGFVPYGHVSLYDSKGYLSDKYEDMITQVGHENFDNLVNSLPEVLKKGVSSAYEKLTNDRSYQDARNLEEDVRYFLELRDLEKRLAKKENEVVSSFGRSLHVDSDLMAEAESKYLGTQEYRERFKKAVESDPLLYSRLERVRYELGTDIVNMAGAREILYGNLYSLPDSPLGKKELVRELVKEGMVFQAGEYPTIRKELPPPIIPVEKEKKEHPHLKKIFAIGAALTITGTGITALAGQLAKNDAGYYFKQIGNMFFVPGTPNNQTNGTGNQTNGTEPPVLDGYDQWAVQNFGSLSNPDARRSLDPDHDYVDNLFEYQNGTDPKTAYTYEGLDDFNLLYTYPHCFTNISDRKLTQKEINEFLTKIPDVEPRYWTNKDGSVAHTYVDGKYINVSLKDPLVQYYAKKVNIEWKDDKDFGKFGELKLGNEPLFLEYGTFDANKSGVPPAYYLTHGRKGNCAEVAIAHMAVLILKGYNSTQCGCYIKNDGKKYGHGFAETFIDGKVYAVNFNQLWPREGKNGESIYERWNWILKENYDRNWVENKNYNYM